MSVKGRYDGRPLLRLLECYVLWSIGELSSADSKNLEAMEAKLQQVFGRTGTWQDVIAAEMDLPSGFQARVRELWAAEQARARGGAKRLSAEEFASALADEATR